VGALPGALSAWERAVVAADDEGDPEAIVRARSGLGLVRAARGEAELAADGLAQAINDLPQGDPMWPRVAQALAAARLSHGNVEGAAGLWQHLMRLGDEMGGGAVGAQALSGMGLVELVRGDLVAGRNTLDEAEVRLRDRARPLALIEVLLRLGELALADGRLYEAGERAAEVERIAWEIPRMVSCVQAMGLGALARIARGQGGPRSPLPPAGVRAPAPRDHGELGVRGGDRDAGPAEDPRPRGADREVPGQEPDRSADPHRGRRRRDRRAVRPAALLDDGQRARHPRR